jgi:DNA (cytosine-5)-methyltransferase 1
MHELALFAGAGGGILGGTLLGWRTVCAVEINTFCAQRLMQRQNEGHLPPFPIWDDVCTFDGSRWRGIIDVVSGGFPCQDISCAGNGVGIDGPKSGLWHEMARIIRDVRPRFALVENSPMLTGRGLGRVLGDLAEVGYNARWGVFRASDVGAPHKRERLFIVAHAVGHGCARGLAWGTRATEPSHGNGLQNKAWDSIGFTPPASSIVARDSHGMAGRLERIRAVGNGQVPAVVVRAWNELTRELVE